MTPIKKTRVPALPPPWTHPPFLKADAAALQALVRGDASPEQQQRAMNWIINEASGTYAVTYRTDPRDHAFGDGRRFVGQIIVGMLKLPLANMKD